MIINKVKAVNGVAVAASITNSAVSNTITPTDPWSAHIRVVLSAVSEATGITFKLQDSFDGGATYYDVGSESQFSLVKKLVVGGVAEVTDTTWPTHSAAANGDYLFVTAYDGTTYAVYLNKRVAEVQTLTFPDKATAVNGDYIVIEDTAGVKYAVALVKPVAEVQTVTLPDFATIVDRDYVVVEDTAGVKYAVYADKTGTSIAPTGAAYVAATHKVKADISAATTVTDVTDAFETAFNTLTGFTAAITTSGTTTLIMTSVIKAPVVNPVPKAFDDATAGTIIGVQTTGGVASQTPTGAIWTAATHKGLADLSSDTSAANVAARVETALNLLTGLTDAITTDDTAADGTMTLTQILGAPTTNPVPKSFDDAGAGTITGVQTTGGVLTSAVPTGVLYVAAAQKIVVNIEPLGTAAQTAAAARTAVLANAAWLTDFSTSDVTTATFTITQIEGGTSTDPAPKREDDGAAGSITVSVTTAGSNGTGINISTDTLTSVAHGFLTGDRIIYRKDTLAAAGLTDGTIYYVIKTATDTLKLAETYDLAFAGTAINITRYGTGSAHALYQSSYEIRMTSLDASDLAQLPLWESCVVVATTGSGDSCTVGAVYVSELPA